MSAPNTVGSKRIKVWDLPLRLFHWLLLVAVATAFYAIYTDNIELHAKAGYCVAGLLIFRIIWGFVGGTHARFFNFIKGPSAIKSYLSQRDEDGRSHGHNPLGALSVIGLLGVLVVQVTTGLFNHSDDTIPEFAAPLYKFVSNTVAGQLAAVHELMEFVILGLIALHIVAIVYYRIVKRDRLIKPMITGSKDVPESAQASDAQDGGIVLGLIVAAIATGIVWYIVNKL